MPGSEPADQIPHSDLADDWFEATGDPLEQGDILIDFSLPALTFDGDGNLGIGRADQTVIVVTQSCDVPKVAQTELLLASVFSYAVIRETSDIFKSSSYRKSLAEGLVHAEFAMPPRPGGDGEFMVVTFRKLHVVPKAYVEANLPAEQLRLSSPYKEYFAQAYARFMMRVGLPLPLPAIK